jgi:hypothetical protein
MVQPSAAPAGHEATRALLEAQHPSQPPECEWAREREGGSVGSLLAILALYREEPAPSMCLD